MAALSAMPKRSGSLATTMVLVATWLGFQIARLLVRLVIEPDLGDEYGEDAEHDGKSDHHNGAGAHGFCLV